MKGIIVLLFYVVSHAKQTSPVFTNEKTYDTNTLKTSSVLLAALGKNNNEDAKKIIISPEEKNIATQSATISAEHVFHPVVGAKPTSIKNFYPSTKLSFETTKQLSIFAAIAFFVGILLLKLDDSINYIKKNFYPKNNRRYGYVFTITL